MVGEMVGKCLLRVLIYSMEYHDILLLFPWTVFLMGSLITKSCVAEVGDQILYYEAEFVQHCVACCLDFMQHATQPKE